MSMWIRIDCDMPNHPKVEAFADFMGIDEVTAFGAIVRFYTWVKQYYPNGNIDGCKPSSVLRAMGLTEAVYPEPEEGWDARVQSILQNQAQESYKTCICNLSKVVEQSYLRRMKGSICPLGKVHDARVLNACAALHVSGLVDASGQVSGWEERQPNRGRKPSGELSKQAVAAHKRWGHTAEKPGKDCIVCQREFGLGDSSATEKTRDQPYPNLVSDVQDLHKDSCKNVVQDLTKNLSLQYNTIQYRDNMCSNEHITRLSENPAENESGAAVAGTPEPDTILDHDPELQLGLDPEPDPGTPVGQAGESGRDGDAPDGTVPAGPEPDDGGKSDDGAVAVRGETPDGFDEFWEQYPRRNNRRDGKRDAVNRWAKLTKTQREQAVQALGEYAKAAGKYPVNASRYLGADSAGVCFFEDYLEPQVAPSDTSRFTGNSHLAFDPKAWEWDD